MLVFLAGSPYQNTRFFLSAMPPVAILIAVGVWRAGDARRRAGCPGGASRSGRASSLAIAGAWLLVAILVAGRFTAAFIDRQAGDLAAIRRLEADVPAGARIISMGPTGVFVRDGVPDVVELFDLDPDGATALLADGRPSYLVIDPVAMAGQWAGRRPALTVGGGPDRAWSHPDRRGRRLDAVPDRRGLRVDRRGSWDQPAVSRRAP